MRWVQMPAPSRRQWAELLQFHIFFLQRELPGRSTIYLQRILPTSSCNSKVMDKVVGEKSLLQSQCCDAPTLWIGHLCTFRFHWTYATPGRTPLPAEQISCKAPWRVELLCTILTKLTIHHQICPKNGTESKRLRKKAPKQIRLVN